MDKPLEPEIIEYIKGHLHDDPFSLSLQAKKSAIANIEEAILQIQARQKALKKLPSIAEDFDLIFPPPVSVEQASSEVTARFKSHLFSGKSFVDLTGGMGIDSLFFSDNFTELTYVEAKGELCELAAYNFGILGKKNIGIVQSSAEEYLSKMDPSDLIYLDPSRRSEDQKKVFRIEDCLPNILEMEEELVRNGKNVLIKLSPLADIKDTFQKLKFLQKVWVVAVKNECKELLCLLSDSGRRERSVEAVNIAEKENKYLFSLDREEELTVDPGPVADYLYEPNAAIMKAGAFKLISTDFNLNKLHKNSHLYSSDKLISFPGRIFQIKDIVKPDKKAIKSAIGDWKVNVISRNFHLKPEDILKKFKLKPGDDKFLIATTLFDNSRVLLLCDRIK